MGATRNSDMQEQSDLYDSHYGNLQTQVYQEIRRDTYGEDLGQTSWITVDECREFLRWLALTAGSRLLDVACGSGGVACFISSCINAQVVGIDINEHAIEAASERAHAAGLHRNVQFKVADGSQPLPFPDEVFDAVFCNDSINHLPDRSAVLQEWHRILRPKGKVLYTDPIVVTGMLTNEEMATRSSIGFFLFTPVEENERLLEQAGFTLLKKENATDRTARVSKRWYEAREQRWEVLVAFEGQENYDALQRFLKVVHRLSSEGRLSRYAYLAQKRE